MNFNLEEKRKIRKAYKTVMKDLELILQVSKGDSVCITFDEVIKEFDNAFNFDCEAKYGIEANSKEVRLLAKWKYISGIRDSVSLAQINSFKKVKPLFYSYDICATFVRLYPEIRKKLIEKIKIENETKEKNDDKERQSKERVLRELEIVQNRYSTSVAVELDLPETQNRHKIVVSREGDKTVGVINFGYSSIKLVTKGDLVLINKDENNKNDRVKRIK